MMIMIIIIIIIVIIIKYKIIVDHETTMSTSGGNEEKLLKMFTPFFLSGAHVLEQICNSHTANVWYDLVQHCNCSELTHSCQVRTVTC